MRATLGLALGMSSITDELITGLVGKSHVEFVKIRAGLPSIVVGLFWVFSLTLLDLGAA
jgi:ABC-type phosphate transport system permease subunit